MLDAMEHLVWGALVALAVFGALLMLVWRARPIKPRRVREDLGPMRPSTAWREAIAADETERFERYAREYVGMQKRHLAKEGAGRAVHRKQVLALRGELEVLSTIPDEARHGLFREPGRYPALVRLSNGAAAKNNNAAPDLRGFAIHLSGVSGPGAMGVATDSQDFVLLNHSWLPFANVDDFVQFGVRADAGPLSLLGYLVARYGVFGIPGMLAALAKLVTAPFKGFAHAPFHSVAPIACGPHAVRVLLLPGPHNGEPPARASDWVASLRSHLRTAPLTWELRLQFYSDEHRTPIEDMSVDWPSPYVTVARFTVPLQDVGDAALAATVEGMTFDTWRHALEEHRPLGNVMRARRVAYVANARARGAQV